MQSLPWIDPLQFTMNVMANEPVNLSHLVFLYSGRRTGYSGRYSYLAYDPVQTIEGEYFSTLKEKIAGSGSAMWFGYLGYGLKDSLEQLNGDTPNWYHLPNLSMTRFHNVIRFDHDNHILEMMAGIYPTWVFKEYPTPAKEYQVEDSSLASNMSKSSYLGKVADIIERIHRGDLYQANLTRKFTGQFTRAIDSFELFRRLCEVSPASYSAFIRLNGTDILSSSPELFLAIDEHSGIRTRPIKGTSPRFSDPKSDFESLKKLENSAKDRAENLMIVDLMRNDLSRSCVAGSVKTEALFEITTHANVHHMSSTITGRINPNYSNLDAIAGCFPPGSMTGAPKIKAMNVCSELEQLERGIYSGAIGWLTAAKGCELSVVIRTLIIQKNQFEFQVGGGITADSIPEQERLETIDKAKGILLALGLDVQAIDF